MWNLLSRLVRRDFDETDPEPDPFAGRTTVPVRIRSDEHLTEREFYREGGKRSGRAWWWLREQHGGFVRIELPRGDEAVDCELRLPPGRYILGVGRDVKRIRRVIVVEGKEGS